VRVVAGLRRFIAQNRLRADESTSKVSASAEAALSLLLAEILGSTGAGGELRPAKSRHARTF
jgi:hypothetical protein